MDINNYNYYLFTIDVLKKPSNILTWHLKDGKYVTVLKVNNGKTTGSFRIEKLADQFHEHLSEIYIFNKFDHRAVISFCQTKPDFIKSIINKSNDLDFQRSDIAQFYWENYKDMGYKIPIEPLDLASIFSMYLTKDHKQLYYIKSPILLYIEPKQVGIFSEQEMLSSLNELKKKFDFFHNLTTIFTDSSTTSFLNHGHYTDNTLVFLSNQNLNDEKDYLKFNRFFFNIIDYIIANHTLNYFSEELKDIDKKIDKFLEEGQYLKRRINKKGIQKYEEYHFSILALRNNFNIVKSQIENLSPTIKKTDSEIKYSLKSRITESINLTLPHNEYNLAHDLSQNIDNSLLEIEDLLYNINEKIGLQEKFTLSYFQTINALENIELQKRVYILSKLVLILTIIVFLFSQWGENTLLYLIVKLLKSI